MRNMAQFILKNNKYFLLGILFFHLMASCHWGEKKGSSVSSNSNPSLKSTVSNLKTRPAGKILLPSGKMLDVRLAVTQEEQVQGLSGVLPHQFEDYDSLLFFNLEAGPRTFW